MADEPYQYEPPALSDAETWWLVAYPGQAGELRFPFTDRLEIGRRADDGRALPGALLIDDPTVSRKHCTLTRTPDGRCHLRDTSRNGTWLDGRRLVPNIEVAVRVGQMIQLGRNHRLLVDGVSGGDVMEAEALAEGGTMSVSIANTATVLVGDIRGFTVLVREVLPGELQRSVSRVFQRLEAAVADLGGVVKEYPGDAIFAFWDRRASTSHAVAAGRAALALHELTGRLAADPSCWSIASHPLRMDWALATGPVMIKTLGGNRPTGLSMVGEPVVLAFRLEKLANDATGPIVACARTAEMLRDSFELRDLGLAEVQGFAEPRRVYAVVREKSA